MALDCRIAKYAIPVELDSLCDKICPIEKNVF